MVDGSGLWTGSEIDKVRVQDVVMYLRILMIFGLKKFVFSELVYVCWGSSREGI